MAERVAHQLGENEDLVPVPPLLFTLFPYKALDEVILLWWSGIPLLDRLYKDDDFKENQQSLMPTLFPPPVVRSQYSCSSTQSLFMFNSSIHACIQLISLQAPADIPFTSRSVPVDPIGPVDIILPF